MYLHGFGWPQHGFGYSGHGFRLISMPIAWIYMPWARIPILGAWFVDQKSQPWLLFGKEEKLVTPKTMQQIEICAPA
jgi:hypothetical protein